MAKTVEESATGKCGIGLDHTVAFDQGIGEVCEACGQVVLEIENIWTRDVRPSCHGGSTVITSAELNSFSGSHSHSVHDIPVKLNQSNF